MDGMVTICTRDDLYCVEIQCPKTSGTVFGAAEGMCGGFVEQNVTLHNVY